MAEGITKDKTPTWPTLGGQQGQTLQGGVKVSWLVEQMYNGEAWLHLTSPLSGWTKKRFITVTSTEPTPDPDPVPVPSPTPELLYTIEFYSDHSLFINGVRYVAPV